MERNEEECNGFVPESLLEDLLFVLVKELRVDDDDPLKRIEEIGKRGERGM